MIRRVAPACYVCILACAAALAQEAPPPEASQPPAAVPVSLEQVLDRAREFRDRAAQTTDTALASQALQEAANLLSAILQRDPAHVEANVLLGEVALQGNDYDRARAAFSKALETEPSNFRANFGVGKIYAANQWWRQAAAFLEAAEKVAPEANRVEVKRLLAIAYAGAKDNARAIAKAQEAVQGNPNDLDALQTLVQIRTETLKTDPRQIDAALQDVEKYVRLCVEALRRTPWDRAALGRLAGAYQLLVTAPPNVGVLQAYHASFYEAARGQATDRLKPGKGPDAAAVLVRIAETIRQQSLVNLVGAEHDAVLFAERAIADSYAPSNVKYLEYALASYQQLQELTARLAGPEVYNDTALRDRAVGVARRIIGLDPQNAAARDYLQSVGLPPTTQPGG